MSQLDKILDELVKQRLAGNGAEAPGPKWGGESAEIPPFASVAIPIKVETPFGPVRCYVALPPEACANQEALVGAIARLKDMGMFIDTIRSDFNGGGRFGGGGGGWGGGGGGGNGWGGGRPWGGGGYGGGGGFNGGYRPRY